MYAGFYPFSLHGKISQKEIRNTLKKDRSITLPYFVSCENIQEDNVKDQRIVIIEEEDSIDKSTGDEYRHKSCKIKSGSGITGYFVPMTRFDVIKID